MMGMGMGVGFSAPPPWTPAAIPGCILYGGAYEEARATRRAQPTLLDGACEDVTKWGAVNSAALSNIAGGVAGNCMHVVRNGVASPRARQVALISGNRYAVTGWGRGDGVRGYPYFLLGSTIPKLGAIAANWQDLSGEVTATGTEFDCTVGSAATDGDFADFDSLTLRNLSLTSYAPQFTTVAGSVLAQATATAQPWVSSDGLGIRFQGGDLLQWNAAASNVKCLHDGTGGTLIVAVRPNALNAQNVVAATMNSAAAVGIMLLYDNANNVSIWIANGSGAFNVNATAATPIAIGNTYVLTLRVASGAGGVTVRKNGVNVIASALTAPSAADPAWAPRFGSPAAGSGAGIDGILGHPFVANRVLTDAECAQAEAYILAQATL